MISEAKLENLNSIAAVHRMVLKDTFTSRVGKSFIETLYESLLNDSPQSKVFVEKESGIVKGFISFTQNRLAVNNKINRSLGLDDKLRLIIFIMLHPPTLLELFSKVRLDRYIAKRYKDSYPSILTLGVAPEYQGGGIGRDLILETDKYFREQGFPKYYVDTKTENKSAVEFYLKLGFRRVATISGNIIFERDI